MFEPPIDPDDTQPTEAANPFYGVPPGFLAELEIKLRDAWAAAEQIIINGHAHALVRRIWEDLDVSYKQVRAERTRLDALTDSRVDLYPNPPTD